MNDHKKSDVVQNYLIPLGLAIAILALSQLLNLVHIQNLLIAAGLCGTVLGLLFLGQYAAFRSLRVQERDALFGILSTITFSGSRSVPMSGVITQSDVLGIESTSREVWIYAYDLNFEQFDRNRSPFTNAVVTNLEKGILYRYLLPSSDKLIIRAERLRNYLSQFTSSADQLQFRVTGTPPQFNQMAIALYNPDTVEGNRRDNDESGTVAVFFPHAEDFAGADAGQKTPFIAVRGRHALLRQEKFERLWRDASSMELSRSRRA